MTCLGSTAAVVSPGEEKALCSLSTTPRPHPPRPAGWSGWFRRTALELTTWWIELSIRWEIGWFQTPEQADRACTRLVRFPDTVNFFHRTRCALISGWSNGWYYAHEEPSSAPQALAQSFTTARVTRRENSGSPCGESWTAQGSRSPIWTSLARWYLLRGLTGRQSNADWSSVWCRPRGRSRSRLLAERVGLTLSPAGTWARWSCWTPTPTLVAAQKDEARTTFKGGYGFHSSGLWCVTTPTSWARSIL